jgi:putative ABC transport system ATP-binding protein
VSQRPETAPPPGQVPAIELTAVTVGYGGSPVLKSLDWRVELGEHWLVIGPSGAGKSTLLHMLAGFLTPAMGTAKVLGTDLATLAPPARDRFRGGNLAIVFQRQHLVQALNVTQNLGLARRLAGLDAGPEVVHTTLHRLGVDAFAQARPAELSVGEAQRVALARALVVEPKILLADEPTASLDDRNAETVTELLAQEAERLGSTLVMTTHDARVRERFAQRLVLDDGECP